MKPAHPLDEIAAVVRGARTIVVATHAFPDGDALGSQLALGAILVAMGKQVRLYSEEPVSYLYDFLPGSDRLDLSLDGLTEADCLIALDCGDRFRLGTQMELLLTVRPVMVIDHHAGHRDFGDLRWIDPARSSTGEMVFQLAKTLEAPISRDAAYCLFTAIVSDTGSFKYASTTGATLQAAAELVAKGVNPEDVAGKLFDNFTEGRLHLLQKVLATLELHGDGKVGVICATREMFEQTGATAKDTETFVNYPRSLASVRVALFLKQPDDQTVSVSLRSKGNCFDVAELARELGGGGHRNAAGFKRRDGTSLADLRQEVLSRILARLDQSMDADCLGR